MNNDLPYGLSEDEELIRAKEWPIVITATTDARFHGAPGKVVIAMTRTMAGKCRLQIGVYCDGWHNTIMGDYDLFGATLPSAWRHFHRLALSEVRLHKKGR